MTINNPDEVKFNKDGYDQNGFDRNHVHRITGTKEDLAGIEFDGLDKEGYDREGYNVDGFNKNGINRDTGRSFDLAGYDLNGFDNTGLDKNGFNSRGFNSCFCHKTTSGRFGPDGYDAEGYDYNGFNNLGIDKYGYDRSGFDDDGLDRHGFGRDGYNLDGFDRYGFGRDGYNLDGFDRHRFNRDGCDVEGFDRSGFNINGYDRYGCGRDGYDPEGYDCYGFNRSGIDKEGFDKKTGYNENGFDRHGFGNDGYDHEGYRQSGYNKQGFDRGGFSRSGFNENGFDRNGFDNNGYNHQGYDKNGYNTNGINLNGYIAPNKWLYFVALTTLSQNSCNEWSAKESYKLLDKQDLALAFVWANDSRNDKYTIARMLSARTAEKLAMKFYECLGFSARDISIKQLNAKPDYTQDEHQNWKLYDILLNGEISIDVKNARTPINSRATYVEHCVSKFKNDRNNQNIIIAGILSPYVQLIDVENPSYVPIDGKIIYLGETTISVIEKLQERFSKDFLQISFSSKNFIPRWMFEFPEKFYEQRNQSRIQLRQVLTENIPTIEFCEQKMTNPIPAYLSCGLELPHGWKPDLTYWQINFYNQLRPSGNSTVSLPILFLSLLTHFLEIITNSELWHDYDPDQYRQLLYCSYSKKNNYVMPLGIFDPLGTINDFIETLSILWQERHKTALNGFKQFKFNGVGLLEGKRLGQKKYETILAYCGGYIEGRGKCGNTPLIVGEHQTCPQCGKLVCDQCGHCSNYCPLCADRMLETF